MKVLLADNQQKVITAFKECNSSSEVHLGNPLSFEIDAIVSPANSLGIMNGGFDAVLRRFFGTYIEQRVRMYLHKFELEVGNAIAITTGHKKIKWVIVSPTVSAYGAGFSGYPSVSYACAYSSVHAAYQTGAKSLGMTGLGMGAGGLEIRKAARSQCQAIEDALENLDL